MQLTFLILCIVALIAAAVGIGIVHRHRDDAARLRSLQGKGLQGKGDGPARDAFDADRIIDTERVAASVADPLPGDTKRSGKEMFVKRRDWNSKKYHRATI